jgi:hypothetical protein
MPGSRKTQMWEKGRGVLGRVKRKDIGVGVEVGRVMQGLPVGIWGVFLISGCLEIEGRGVAVVMAMVEEREEVSVRGRKTYHAEELGKLCLCHCFPKFRPKYPSLLQWIEIEAVEHKTDRENRRFRVVMWCLNEVIARMRWGVFVAGVDALPRSPRNSGISLAFLEPQLDNKPTDTGPTIFLELGGDEVEFRSAE